MIKKLVRHGNSLAIVIERPILALLEANEKTTFKVITDGKRLMFTPIKQKAQKKSINKE